MKRRGRDRLPSASAKPRSLATTTARGTSEHETRHGRFDAGRQ